MPESLQHFISERGFDRFRPGLESRFKANRLDFNIQYSEGSPLPSLRVRLENAERIGEVCVWENGHCDITICLLCDGKMDDKHLVLESTESFHEHLAALFLYVTNKKADATG